MQISWSIFLLSAYFSPLNFYPDFILEFFPDFFRDFFPQLSSQLFPQLYSGLFLDFFRFLCTAQSHVVYRRLILA